MKIIPCKQNLVADALSEYNVMFAAKYYMWHYALNLIYMLHTYVHHGMSLACIHLYNIMTCIEYNLNCYKVILFPVYFE